MSQIQVLHQQAMDFAEAAAVSRLRGALEQAAQFTRQAFELQGKSWVEKLRDQAAFTLQRGSGKVTPASPAIHCGYFCIVRTYRSEFNQRSNHLWR